MKKEDGDRVRERAGFWRCRIRTMQLMIKDGVPVDDPAAMVAWHAALPSRSQGMLVPAFSARIYEERAKLEGKPIGAPSDGDSDAEAFQAQYKPSISDEKDNLADIKRERAFYLFRVKRARARHDRAGEAEALKHYGRLADIVHDCELRAQRLGRDLGESFSASDVERLGRSVAYWLMNSADTTISQIASGILAAAATGPMDREAVRRVVEPVILAERMLAPMARAAAVNAPIALPAKLVAAMREGAASCIEDGAAEFDRLYSQPVPEPGAASPPVAENAA